MTAVSPGKVARSFRTLFLFAALASSAAWANGDGASANSSNTTYQQRNLVSDGSIPAENTDPNLINAWGIAFNPFAFVWVADNGTGVSTLYDGTGKPQSLVVQIPGPANSGEKGKPTGIAFNGSNDFVVSKGDASGPARFIFATENGVIAGWSPNADPTHAIRVVDNSSTNAVYKGLAISAGGRGGMLYAADFSNNRVDVFDSSFKPVTLSSDAFTDPNIPSGFAPFGIQAIQGDIYVTYAKVDPSTFDDVAGPGNGYVNVFDPNGKFIRRIASKGQLNAPWGITVAPAGFGEFSNRLLIGNFGDGTINAYDLATGHFVGTLKGSDHQPLKIDGLWGLAFGNGYAGQPVNSLFFTAGPGDEEHGLYGRIDSSASATQSGS